MKVFVVHCSKLDDRKKHIIEELKSLPEYEFVEVEDYDETLYEGLQPTKISLLTKHFFIYKLIAEQYDSALILEDDVILSDDFATTLDKYMKELPEDYDMLFIGNGCNLHIQKQDIIGGKHIYEKGLYPTSWGGDGCSRCTDSYVVSKKCATELCKYIPIEKVNLPVDWWLNKAGRYCKFKVYWAEPTIVTQGSHNGLFPHTL